VFTQIKSSIEGKENKKPLLVHSTYYALQLDTVGYITISVRLAVGPPTPVKNSRSMKRFTPQISSDSGADSSRLV
jgi:hypothetical protein